MLTNALVFPTDLFTGGFPLAALAGLKEGGLFEIERLWSDKPEPAEEETELDGARTGGDGGVEEVEKVWDFPPRRKPFPLNGMTFLMSWDPEPEQKDDSY